MTEGVTIGILGAVLVVVVLLLRRLRALRGALGDVGERVRELERRASAPRPEPDAGLADRVAALEREGAGSVRASEALAEKLALLTERVAAGPEGAADGGPRESSPTELARRFLLGEGFDRIQLLRSEITRQGLRIAVRATRGDELQAGHVLVADGVVTEAELSVPTSLFP